MKEGNVLFNDALIIFYLRLYGVRHMVKNHSHRERGNPLPPHRLLFSIGSKGSFICIIPDRKNTYHGLCYTSRGALAGTRNSAIGPPWRIDPTTHRSYHGATSRSPLRRKVIGVSILRGSKYHVARVMRFFFYLFFYFFFFIAPQNIQHTWIK